MKRFTLVAALVVVAVLAGSGTAFGGKTTVTLLPCSNDPAYQDGSGSLSMTFLRGSIQLPGGDWLRGYEYWIQYQFRGLPEGYYELSWFSSRGGLSGGPYVIYVSRDGTSSGTISSAFSQYKLDYFFLTRVEWSDVSQSWQRVDPYSALCSGR